MPDAPDYTNRRHFAVSRLLQARIGGFTLSEYELLKAHAADVLRFEGLRLYKVLGEGSSIVRNSEAELKLVEQFEQMKMNAVGGGWLAPE